jgi:predicted transcriptional regulator
MVTVQIKLSVEDIITTLPALDKLEREKLQNALFELQNDLELQQAVDEGLDDIINGRVSNHDAVMTEIKAKYNY